MALPFSGWFMKGKEPYAVMYPVCTNITPTSSATYSLIVIYLNRKVMPFEAILLTYLLN
jgi:hypothetical protein